MPRPPTYSQINQTGCRQNNDHVRFTVRVCNWRSSSYLASIRFVRSLFEWHLWLSFAGSGAVQIIRGFSMFPTTDPASGRCPKLLEGSNPGILLDP